MTDSAVSFTDVRVTRQGLRARLLNPPAKADEGAVLDDVSFSLAAGGTLSILGESGSGKSTLMRCVNRLVDPDAGAVQVQGRDVTDWNVRELRAAAVYVPQRPFLFGGSVRDELTQALRWSRRTGRHAPLADALQAVGLDVDPARDATELSEGQRHRLCIARALLLEPAILLLDEPTGSLDVRTSREILGAIRQRVADHGTTLMVITHRPEDLETLGGEALILLNGKVAGRYPAADIVAGNVNADVGNFLGSPAGGAS